MSIDAAHLAERLRASISSPTGDEAALGWLWPALLRELARGRPVTAEHLATVTGREVADVRDGLAALCDTEYDEAGAVIGHGITLIPTPHRFTVDGHTLHTWCALDTLIFPTVLGRSAHVESPTPGDGDLVTFTLDPATGVSDLAPATAMISVLVPEPGSRVRSAFCNHVHFYATRAAAQGWLTEHPAGVVLGVGEAFELGRHLAEHLLTNRTDSPLPGGNP